MRPTYRIHLLQAWFDREYAACLSDPAMANPSAGAAPVQHLLARTATLQQAGGTSLMALRGHAGTVRRVVISPDGRDVLTASDDGGVQVGGGFFVLVGCCCMVRRGAACPACRT
jgi:hypothetical protein